MDGSETSNLANEVRFLIELPENELAKVPGAIANRYGPARVYSASLSFSSISL